MASRWATDEFTGPGSDHLWTTGFKSKLIEVEEQHIQLQIWDGQSFDAGQVTRLGKRLGHSSVSNSYYKGVKAVLVVYDPTDPASFRDVSTLCRRAEAHIDPDAKVFLLFSQLFCSFFSIFFPSTASRRELFAIEALPLTIVISLLSRIVRN